MKKIVFVVFGAFMAMAVSGCQTWAGFGKDVEKVGESMQRAGDKK